MLKIQIYYFYAYQTIWKNFDSRIAFIVFCQSK